MFGWSIGMGAVLAIGLMSQFVFSFRGGAKSTRPDHLQMLVPSAFEGWLVQDLPIGPSEFASQAAWEELRYDEFIHRSYKRGSVEFSVYVAYWGRGSMPARIVASHTPDRCFTLNGMNCAELRHRVPLSSEKGVTRSVEWRRFRVPMQKDIHVMYWHVVEGVQYDYGGTFNAIPNPLSWIKDVFAQAAHGSGEQYFLRVTSSSDFAEIQSSDGFRKIVDALCNIGGPDADRGER
jgi:hypothetical protein